MKAMFLGVCLLNIVFFFWEFHQGALNPPARTQTLLPTILLVDELEKARRGAAISVHLDRDAAILQHLHTERVADKPIAMLPSAKPKKAAVAQTPPVVCHEVGPFSDQQAATAWAAGQSSRGEVFDREVLTASAYLVYYRAARNPEQTRIHKMMLNAKGITDIWVVPNGDLKGALSLGLFNDQPRAAFFRNQLLQRGVQAEIKERYKSQSRTFVRIKGEQKIPQRLLEGITSASCVKQ
jgi:hypothetical protein